MATYTIDKIEFGSNVYNIEDANALPKSGGTVTGPVVFGDSVSMTELTTGDLVVTGSASFANNLQAVTINGVTVGSSPKFTDTITTATTSGSGNAVTAISASNGALTVTKGSTFLTSHQTIKQDAVTGATGNHYASCTTAAATAAKTASITAGTPALEAGLRVSVKFSNANTAGTPTLNINSLGAKNIFHKGAQITTGSNKALLAGLVDFIYDGTQWHLVGNYLDTNTTYTGAASHTTGISIANHGTTSITGVSGSVTGSHVKSGGNGTAPTLGTAFSVPNVTAVGSGSFTSGTFNGGSGSFSATVSSHVMSFSHTHTAATHGPDSHTHTAPTLGTAFTIPNVTSAGSASNWVFENVTVPKAASATTVVTGYTHTITDNGHTHTLTTS